MSQRPLDELEAFALQLPGAFSDMPWEGDVVAKVGPKVFAFLGSEGVTVGVKCGKNRDEADEWLHRYPEDATASSYIGRYGWNSIVLDDAIGDIPDDDELRELVDASYEAVVARLPKRLRPA